MSICYLNVGSKLRLQLGSLAKHTPHSMPFVATLLQAFTPHQAKVWKRIWRGVRKECDLVISANIHDFDSRIQFSERNLNKREITISNDDPFNKLVKLYIKTLDKMALRLNSLRQIFILYKTGQTLPSIKRNK